MNVPPVPENIVPGAVKLTVLEPPSSVPNVLVQVPLKVWVNPAPRLRVPPDPFIVSAAPFTAPVRVAVPPDLVIETAPELKPAIVCVPEPLIVTGPVVEKKEVVCVPDPLMIIGEAFAVKVPLLVKFPPRVT